MKKGITKSLKLISLFLGISISVFSCATNKPASINAEEEILIEDDKIVEEEKIVEVCEPEPEPEPEPPAPSPLELYIEEISDIKISVTSVPKEVVKNKKFATPFEILVTKNDLPFSCPISITYPTSKETFETINVVTNEDGTYSFVPENNNFAANTIITVTPTPAQINPETISEEEYESMVAAIKTESDKKSATGIWKVKSDILQKGAVLFVWDYDERNRAERNSYELLSELRGRGSQLVGNAPVNETSDIGRDLKDLWKRNYEYIEDTYGYLITGTIKFVHPVTNAEDDSGKLCSLVAEISAVNMKNGEMIFSQELKNETIGKNWNDAVSTCKKQLSKQIVDALIYGL